MVRKVAFWLLWVGFVGYAFLLAPANQPDTPELIKNLSTGNWQGINSLVVSLFNIMGVWPMIYACLLLADGRGQKLPAWLFTGLSFAVGAFAVLPYLGWRESNPGFVGDQNITLKILDSRFTGFILTVVTVALISYGLRDGNWGDFIQQWTSDRFIHVMSLDFCLLCLIFPAVLGDDMARRGMKNSLVFWGVSLIPLFGPLVYLCLRPPLVESLPAVEEQTITSTTRSAR